MDGKKRLMTDGNLYKGLLVLALPVMLSNLLKALHDIIATFFLAGAPDAVNAQAAVAIVSPFLTAVLAFPLGLGIGMVALISRQLGAGQVKGARRTAGAAVTIAIVLAVLLTAATYFLSEPLLKLLCSGKTLEYAVVYSRVRAFEIPAAAAYELFRGLRQAQGDTARPVALSAAALVINTALTGILVSAGYGAAGAAYATVISQWVIVPLCAIGLFYSKRRKRSGRYERFVTIRPRDLKPDSGHIKNVIKMSLPGAASGALAAAGFLVLQYFIRGHGDEVVAAFSICNRITNILTVPVSALAAVLTAFIGQNIGGGQPERAEESYKASRNIAVFLMAAFAAALFFARDWFIGLMSGDEGVRAAAGEYMVWAAATLPLLGLFQNYLGAYNGYVKTGYTFILESVRLWGLRLPLVLIFDHFTTLGRSGIWYAMVISNSAVCVLGYILLKITNYKLQCTNKVNQYL